MAPQVYTDETPAEVKNAKGLHLITMSTPNGQAVQIMLEELKDVYDTEWTTTLVDIMTNDQKKDWFLRLDPNGRIPVLVDNTASPPFPVMETSAEMLYLLKFADKDDKFGFKDEMERSQCLQWTCVYLTLSEGLLNSYTLLVSSGMVAVHRIKARSTTSPAPLLRR